MAQAAVLLANDVAIFLYRARCQWWVAKQTYCVESGSGREWRGKSVVQSLVILASEEVILLCKG